MRYDAIGTPRQFAAAQQIRQQSEVKRTRLRGGAGNRHLLGVISVERAT